MQGFICGCCGAYFRSTVEEQVQHDQDEGYGICPSCDSWIEERNEADWDTLEGNVAGALSDKNRERFLAMETDERRAIMWRMMDDGLITFQIQRGG